MKRLFNKNRVENACVVGSMIAEDFEAMKTKLAAMETKLDKVLKATASDSGKSLLIDASGNVKLST